MASQKAQMKCIEWLVYCLKIGWDKEHLDALEEIWWKFHNSETGELIKMNKKQPNGKRQDHKTKTGKEISE